MNTDNLHLFVAVARRGSFAAVAKERDVDPSSVSRAIADLEGELGLQLFQRSTRSMTLTEAGEIYLARLEPLLDELEHAFRFNDAVLRHLTVKTKAAVTEPSAMMKEEKSRSVPTEGAAVVSQAEEGSAANIGA